MERNPLLSYCAPLMNRLPDLQATLRHNVDVVRQFAGRVDLVIACFDADDRARLWVERNFSDELNSGHLRFLDLDPLPYWHFSWAKNSFKGHIQGQYYSSLDGDNFLSQEDVSRTIDLISESTKPLLIHHFSGHWGDGTSGRITLPRCLYEKHGYIDELFPRQFDEIGLMLSVLRGEPDICFVSRPACSFIEQSGYAKEFVTLNGISVDWVEADLGCVQAPENPRGRGYVEEDLKLRCFQQINASYTLMKLSDTQKARQRFERSLNNAKENFLKADITSAVFGHILQRASSSPLEKSNSLTLYAVIHDDFHLLRDWLEHYRSIGVERFIIVDDYSTTPLEQVLDAPDVYIFRPRLGQFRSFKVFWLMVLMQIAQEEGSWVLTADSDEFLDIPAMRESSRFTPGLQGLNAVCNALEASGLSYATGILVDLFPNDRARPLSAHDFFDQMVYHFCKCEVGGDEYREISSVRWAFGEYWRLAYSVDIRYRLFGTIDCLRKIPLFRYTKDIRLNQGFHDLAVNGQGLSASSAFDPSRPVFPVRHYKLLQNLMGSAANAARKQRVDQYFGRTANNLRKMYDADPGMICRTLELTPFKRAYDPSLLLREWREYRMSKRSGVVE